MNKPIINPKTNRLVDGYINNPNGSLLLVGDKLSMVDDVALEIADKLLGEKNKNSVMFVDKNNGKKIGVQQIRDLKHSMITKINSTSGIGRVALVKNAGEMTIEAQNALLKLIEEPVNNTLVILATSNYKKLLPTIISRCQRIELLPINLKQAIKLAKKHNVNIERAKQAYIISKGQANLFLNLLKNNISTIEPGIDSAKQFLSQTVTEKLANQKTYSTKETMVELLKSLEIVAEAGMHSTNNTTHRWKNVLKTVQECKDKIGANSNSKLVYMKLSLNL